MQHDLETAGRNPDHDSDAMSAASSAANSARDSARESAQAGDATSFTEVEYVAPPAPGATKTERYVTLRGYVQALTEGEPDWLANLANATAAIFDHVPNLNWAGFYLMKDGELVLGPFQGRPACVRIEVGRGVCGTAVVERRTQVVPDVREFPGHIACDARSRSEIVVPIVSGDEVVGVLDLDSAQPANFDIEDRRALETIVRDLAPRVDWRAATRP